MGRAVTLFVVAVAATVLVGACGVAPQRVEVGQLRTETRSVEVENTESVKVNLRLVVGELNVGGGAAEPRLMEADFAYNVAAWEPGVNYEVGMGLPQRTPADSRKEWRPRTRLRWR